MKNRLKELRKERGMAMREITALCRVATGTISAIEKYDYSPAPETREKLARALGVTVQDIWPAGELVEVA